MIEYVGDDSIDYGELPRETGLVLKIMVYYEKRIGKIITSHFSDKNAEEFERIIMNSNITSFGQKIKIIANLKPFDKRTIGRLRDMSTFRNWLAHNTVNVTIRTGGGQDAILRKLNIMNASGQLKEKDYLEEKSLFFENEKAVSEFLNKNFPESDPDFGFS